MKLKMSLLVLLMCLGLTFATEEPMDMEIQSPPQDSALYWNIRSEAVSELIPFLTSKRAEMKQKMEFLADNPMTILLTMLAGWLNRQQASLMIRMSFATLLDRLKESLFTPPSEVATVLNDF